MTRRFSLMFECRLKQAVLIVAILVPCFPSKSDAQLPRLFIFEISKLQQVKEDHSAEIDSLRAIMREQESRVVQMIESLEKSLIKYGSDLVNDKMTWVGLIVGAIGIFFTIANLTFLLMGRLNYVDAKKIEEELLSRVAPLNEKAVELDRDIDEVSGNLQKLHGRYMKTLNFQISFMQKNLDSKFKALNALYEESKVEIKDKAYLKILDQMLDSDYKYNEFQSYLAELFHPDKSHRKRAILNIGAFGGEEYIPLLESLIGDAEDPALTIEAVRSVERIKSRIAKTKMSSKSLSIS